MYVRALSQFLLYIFLLSPTKLAWSQVLKFLCDSDFNCWSERESHVEVGLNTSIVTLWVLGGKEKKTFYSETVKCEPENDWAGEVQQQL
jgi:hypothetical protein